MAEPKILKIRNVMARVKKQWRKTPSRVTVPNGQAAVT